MVEQSEWAGGSRLKKYGIGASRETKCGLYFTSVVDRTI